MFNLTVGKTTDSNSTTVGFRGYTPLCGSLNPSYFDGNLISYLGEKLYTSGGMNGNYYSTIERIALDYIYPMYITLNNITYEYTRLATSTVYGCGGLHKDSRKYDYLLNNIGKVVVVKISNKE